jgi:type IV pilus assembly protein PilX
MSPHYSLPARQQGVALIVALIFLAVLAILGVTIARNSSMEERMAGNTRDRDLAFQAAESALRDAQADLFPGFLGNAFDGSTLGLIQYVANANDPAYWNAYDWNGASQEATAGIANVTAKPRYVIEKKPNTLIPAVPPSVTPTTVQHFRVTARGVGATPETIVILQSEYEI